jgi:hypothetical protein
MNNGKIPFGLQVRFNRAITAALADLNVDPMRVSTDMEEDTENFTLSIKIPKPLIEREVKTG